MCKDTRVRAARKKENIMSLTMTMSLLGGLALFLYGMKMMGEGLEKAAGDKLRRLLESLTRNPIIGLLVGVVFTMIIQSSSATTVMVVGFVNAGLLDLMLLLFTYQALPFYIIILCAFNCLLGCSFVNQPFEKYFGSKTASEK